MNDLREEVRRAFYAIKRNIKFNIPIRIWLKILESAVKFYNHLKGSDSKTFHNKAITYREMNLEKSPLSKLVLGLCSQTQTHTTAPQDSSTIRPNQIMRKQKDNYLTHWKE